MDRTFCVNEHAALSDAALDAITMQIGEQFATLGVDSHPLLARGSLEMAESLTEWILDADALYTSDTDALESLARRTGRWHHQICSGDHAAAFARSVESEQFESGAAVVELFISPLAAKIADALLAVTSTSHGDDEHRLLLVPAYHLSAIWTVRDDAGSIFVADAPDTVSELKVGGTYSEGMFVDALRHGSATAGLLFDMSGH